MKGFIPQATNNVAEYNGLLAALRWAVAHGIETLHIRADSELLVKQMKGMYRVKNPGLLPLYEEAKLLVRKVGQVTFEHVRRELNKDADRLVQRSHGRSGRLTGHPKIGSTQRAQILLLGWQDERYQDAILGRDSQAYRSRG